MTNEKDVLVKIGALWKKEKSLQGTMGDARLIVMENKYKQSSKHPDYVVFVTQKKKKEENNQQQLGIDENEEIPF